MEYVIQTEGLTKIFRDFWGNQRVVAVDKLDLEIRPHEVYGMLGPNGSGKSTTIKVLLGLLFPTRGWAKVLGQAPGEVKTNARIGYLPEESYLYPFLNARETLHFYGRLFGLSTAERKRRIDSLLDMVGLNSVARRPLGEYSKGMTRRIGLAQALINDPDLLILDEPTSGLDPIGTRQIKDLVRELGQRGKTVLMCSHLLADVEDVCDRICILYGGKKQAEGAVDELLVHSDMTQIRSGRLTDQAIDKIKEIIASECDDQQVSVEVPRDRLENYFLQVVAQAQIAQVETSGAIMGTGVSDFLSRAEESADESTVVLEQLVKGREEIVSSTTAEREDVATTSVSDQEQAARDDTLAALIEVKPQSLPSSSNEFAPAQEQTTVPVEPNNLVEQKDGGSLVDRSVIDSLVTDTDKREKKPPKDDSSTDNQEG